MGELPSRLFTPDAATRHDGSVWGVLAVVSDLIFETKIRTTAAALSIPYRAVRTAEQLRAALDDGSWALVIVDMEVTEDAGAEAVAISSGHRSCGNMFRDWSPGLPPARSGR
jgi:hypothetical protein